MVKGGLALKNDGYFFNWTGLQDPCVKQIVERHNLDICFQFQRISQNSTSDFQHLSLSFLMWKMNISASLAHMLMLESEGRT